MRFSLISGGTKNAGQVSSSEIYYAQLVEQESTRTVLAALREVVEQQGIFCALYSDRASHFFLTRKAGEPVDRQRLTQLGRALRGIITLEAANRFLREGYIGEFNRRFAVPATQPGSAFLPSARRELDRIFSIQHQRIVNRDNTVSLENRLLQIEKTPWRGTLAGCRVTVYEHLDGTLSIGYGPHTVGRYSSEGVAIRCGGRRRSPVASRQHHLALTSVALRAPSVSAKSLSVES